MKGNQPHIVLVGCGNLGSALLGRWLHIGFSSRFTVIKPSPLSLAITKLSSSLNYKKSIAEAREEIRTADLIILAIKPQIMPEVCVELKPHLNENTPILSLAAGKTLSTIQSYFSGTRPIMRAMPNTPTATGKGATVCIAGQNTLPKTKSLITSLFETTGLIEWITDESLIDAVTALSASGPAYVYYFIEALTNAAIHNGLPHDLASNLAHQTVIGAAALAEHSKDNVKTLRENVTSKGGVTAAALQVLIDGQFEKILGEALKANIARAKELNR